MAYPIKRSVARLSDLVVFLKALAFFYSVLAVFRSAIPFSLKEKNISPPALRHSLHCYNFCFSTCIPPVLLVAYFWQQDLKVLVRFFFSCELLEPLGQK